MIRTTNSCCGNEAGLVEKFIGTAYDVVKTVYDNLGELQFIYDFLNKYGVLIAVDSVDELKALPTTAKYTRVYTFSTTAGYGYTDYLYVDGNVTGVIPNDPTATGSWIVVASSTAGGGGDTSGGGYIPWVYAQGSALGGETTIAVPNGTVGVPFIIVEGYMNTVGYGFTYDIATLTVTLAQPLEAGDEVVLLLTGTPAVPDNPNISDWVIFNWLYNGGAAVGGEQVISIPYTFQSIPAIFKNGLRYHPGLASQSYTVDATNQRILLTEALATNDRLVIQVGGESEVVIMSDRTVQEVARSANVRDEEVILSSNTTTYLNGKTVIYDEGAQKSYKLPTLPSNVYISSVSGGNLVYNPGAITVALLPLTDSADAIIPAVKNFYLQPTGAANINASSGESVQDILDSINKHQVVNNIAQLVLVDGVKSPVAFVVSFHGSNNYGGGFFRWDASGNKTAHNGGTVIDPSKTFPSTWNDAGKTAWFTADGVGTGVWRRVDVVGHFRAEDFGALPWNVGDAHDSTKEFQQVANVAYRGGCWRWTGRHRILSYIDIPNKQTFGSYAQMTSVYSELIQPNNFQGIHVIADPSLARSVQNAVFYDAASGEAFRCGEGASPTDCLVYGRGWNTTGMDVATALPAVGTYYDVQAFRHSKAINVRNVTVAFMKYALDSNPWDASKGDYYTTTDHMTVLYCYCISRVTSAQEITFNTKHINIRAYVNQVGDYALAVRDVVFIGGSIEGYNTPTFLRNSTQIAFKGTYFETGDTTFTGAVFSLIGWCTLTFEDCLVYLNNTVSFVTSGGSSQSAGVTALTVKASGNTWRKSDTGTSIVFAVDPVTNKQALIGAEVLNPGTGATIAYWAGAVPPGTYTAPISQAF